MHTEQLEVRLDDGTVGTLERVMNPDPTNNLIGEYCDVVLDDENGNKIFVYGKIVEVL